VKSVGDRVIACGVKVAKKGGKVVGKLLSRSGGRLSAFNESNELYAIYPSLDITPCTSMATPKAALKVTPNSITKISEAKVNHEVDLLVRLQALHELTDGVTAATFYDKSGTGSLVLPALFGDLFSNHDAGSTVLIRSVVNGGDRFHATCWTYVLKAQKGTRVEPNSKQGNQIRSLDKLFAS
jgi:hypothetical protein